MRHLFLPGFCLLFLFACSESDKNNLDQNTKATKLSGSSTVQISQDPPLGLPPVPVPVDNPQTDEKVALGKKLFHDKRFSIDGTVSCANCHSENKAFTDGLQFSVGHGGLTGTRNAPTVLNAAFYQSQFWDGREPDLEGQSKQPFVNPVEGGLGNHEPILEIVRTDPEYKTAFLTVFEVSDQQLTMEHIAKAIASFERTLVSGNSPFDRYYFLGTKDALTDAQVRGLNIFIGNGRCVSCHVIEQDQALFTDNRFHNIGIGINDIQNEVSPLVKAFLEAKYTGREVDIIVLTDKKSSELGRFAVTDELTQIGAFKTPTLRNIELTAPYMHDGSLETLKEVVNHYNNGGVTSAGDQVNPFLSGGIRPLDLTDEQIDDLVAFMQALTSPVTANTTVEETAN